MREIEKNNHKLLQRIISISNRKIEQQVLTTFKESLKLKLELLFRTFKTVRIGFRENLFEESER